ncbi:hypothetical protein GCM10023178_26070 [Actinomadura luteofluorescens]
MEDREGQLVVLGQDADVVDVRQAWEAPVPACGDHFLERGGPEDRGGAGEDEGLALQPPDVAGVARVLVALEHADGAAARLAGEGAADGGVPAGGEVVDAVPDEPGVERRVGVHHHDRVVRAEDRQ